MHRRQLWAGASPNFTNSITNMASVREYFIRTYEYAEYWWKIDPHINFNKNYANFSKISPPKKQNIFKKYNFTISNNYIFFYVTSYPLCYFNNIYILFWNTNTNWIILLNIRSILIILTYF